MGKFVWVDVAINTGTVARRAHLPSLTRSVPVLFPRQELIEFDLVRYCMAAASSNGRAIVGSFGKRLTNQMWAAKQCDPALPLISRRASHSDSNYDKDIEEDVNPVAVPDHVIGTQSEKYWSPHPATGVFGPDESKAGDLATGRGRSDPPKSANRLPSALDETVRFRQLELEDVDPEDQK